MQLNLSKASAVLRATQGRFLVAGIWNTAFGYAITILLYALLSVRLHILFIGALANIAAITNSFLVYKIFVYRTKGGWLREYVKCYVVYGASGLFGTGLLWFFLNQMNLNIWIAQAISQALTVLIAYFAHSKFTFKVVS